MKIKEEQKEFVPSNIIYRFSQAYKWSAQFFFRMSQGHNALPQSGLEPGSSDSEPSALTTGLLNKAMALACLQYIWPLMLKVVPCTIVWWYGRTSKYFQLDGLLLFCITMGLSSASSTKIGWLGWYGFEVTKLDRVRRWWEDGMNSR